ncbi:MAG TPA: tetratricopeptide repeat protein, partial [Devosia sp.]|nr:tetratricopeptide repeat protein [Devosia sp.]
PMLEKVATEYADKGVVLAKLNVDEEGFIASQFRVQSIPTVYALFRGQPVADLTNARSESQLRQMLDQLLEKLPVDAGAGDPAAQEVAQIVAMGEEALAGGDAERALGIFAQLSEMAPDNAQVQAGLIRALMDLGETDGARAAFDALPEELKADPALAQAGKLLELTAAAPQDDGELAALRSAAEANPADMDAGFAYAQAAFAAGRRDEAAEALLGMIRAEPEWSEGAAKAKLLQIFEAVGLEDPWVAATRRKLSLLLFG